MKIFSFGLLILLLPLITFSQESDDKSEEEKGSSLAIFLGGSTNKDASAFTIGADYQYRINKIFGVGALIDHAAGDLQSTIIGPALFLHVSPFEFMVAPVIENSDDELSPVVRLGVGYEIELSVLSIVPSVFMDTERAGEITVVYGLSFAFDI